MSCRCSTALFLGLLSVVAGHLPGLAGQETRPVPQSGPTERVRDRLAMYGVDAAAWATLPVHEVPRGDEELIVKLLFHLGRLPGTMLDPAAAPSPDWSQLAEAGEETRGELFRIEGRVRHVSFVPLPPESGSHVGFSRIYRVVLAVAAEAKPIVLFTPRVPDAWTGDAELDEPVQGVAAFVSRCAAADCDMPLYFACTRLGWYPAVESPQRGVLSSHVALARLGVDVGRLFELRQRNRRPLLAEDRDSFYQLLAAMKQGDTPALTAAGVQPLALGELLLHPERHHGALLQVQGHARQITKVLIDDPAIQTRYGLEHYFQIDLFVPLSDQVIRIARKGAEAEGPTFENSFPVTLCVPSLPVGLEPGGNPQGDLRVVAAFFKVWAYTSEYAAAFGEGEQQLSPMLIGIPPVVVTEEPVSPQLGVGLTIVVVLALVGIWIGMARQGGRSSAVRRALGEE